ncbi:hypothetical protein LGH83_11250 [Lichenihabitans sp. PAMC28606]|uniref:hypothetical protein n=1 Tax=Lichenihabitans sp. PAMC28606 TaxID=2880932 RepID=UPI001D0BBB85|nr:hypothetical protein [Lichenihabitans sp. PAMC28606]UDL93189.1 hypothetical protein LGH83_11250 [Lichenihabitans sp. PAMC28606]
MPHVRMILSAALLSVVSTAALASTSAPTLRDKQQAACAGDAQKLCADVMPDVDKVTACMQEKKAQVSEGCRAMYDAK